MLKRAADGNWTRSERVRRALERANEAIRVANGLIDGAAPGSLSIHRSLAIGPEPVEEFVESAPALLASLQYAVRTTKPATSAPSGAAVLALPDDCLRIVLELALSQRTMSVYRADGSVSEPRDYYDVAWLDSCSIHTMRCVSKQWNRVASSLVRTIRIRGHLFKNVLPSWDVTGLFPNATAISYNPHAPVSVQAAEETSRIMKRRWDMRYGGIPDHITLVAKPEHNNNGYRRLFHRVIRRRDGTFVTHQIGAVASLSHADVFRLNVQLFAILLAQYVPPTEPRQSKIRVYLDDVEHWRDSDHLDRVEKIPANIRMMFDIHIMTPNGDSRWTLPFVHLFGKATVHMKYKDDRFYDGYYNTFYDLDAYDALTRDYIVEPLV